MKGLAVVLGCLGFVGIIAVHLLLIPFFIMTVLHMFDVDISFWQTVGAWWLASIVAGLFQGVVKNAK